MVRVMKRPTSARMSCASCTPPALVRVRVRVWVRVWVRVPVRVWVRVRVRGLGVTPPASEQGAVRSMPPQSSSSRDAPTANTTRRQLRAGSAASMPLRSA